MSQPLLDWMEGWIWGTFTICLKPKLPLSIDSSNYYFTRIRIINYTRYFWLNFASHVVSGQLSGDVPATQCTSIKLLLFVLLWRQHFTGAQQLRASCRSRWWWWWWWWRKEGVATDYNIVPGGDCSGLTGNRITTRSEGNRETQVHLLLYLSIKSQRPEAAAPG